MYRRANTITDMVRQYFLLICIFALSSLQLFAQDSIAVKHEKDSVAVKKILPDTTAKKNASDTLSKKKSPASKAALYSAIFPGAGQVYNRKYWKAPIVYIALAIPTYTFVDNLNWFKRTRFAYNTLFNIVNRKDSTGYTDIYAQLKPLVDRGDLSGLQNYRNEFRKNVDYSVLAFLLLWGLNVVDATVDAHLKDFNITDDLSMKIQPVMSGNTAGLGIVFKIGKNNSKQLFTAR